MSDGLVASVPLAFSTLSIIPSPSVSGLYGLEPNAISSSSVRPSPSESESVTLN